MSDLYVQLVSIQPSGSVQATNQQGPGGLSVPNSGSTSKDGPYAQIRSKAVMTAR